MTALAWIVLTGFGMSAIALVGSLTLLMKKATLDRIVMPLVPFAAGNFIYIGASDLVPEVNKHADPITNVIHFLCFVAGLGLLWLMRLALTS